MPSWKDVVDGYGLLKPTIMRAAAMLFTSAAADPELVARIAADMCHAEAVDNDWAGLPPHVRAVWESRARSALWAVRQIIRES